MRWARSGYAHYPFVTGLPESGKSFTVELGMQWLKAWGLQPQGSHTSPAPEDSVSGLIWTMAIPATGVLLCLSCDESLSPGKCWSLGLKAKKGHSPKPQTQAMCDFCVCGAIDAWIWGLLGLKLDDVKPHDVCRDRIIDLLPISKHLRRPTFIQSFNRNIQYVFRYYEPFWNSYFTFPSKLELYPLLW